MIRFNNLPQLVCNKSADQFRSPFKGVLVEFDPIEPSVIYSNLLDTILGSSDNSKIYESLRLLSFALDCALLAMSVIDSKNKDMLQLWSDELYRYSYLTITLDQGVLLSQPGQIWYSTEYELLDVSIAKNSSTNYELFYNNRKALDLPISESGTLTIPLGAEAEQNVVIRPALSNIRTTWAKLPRTGAPEAVQKYQGRVRGVLDSLLQEQRHVLEKDQRSALNSIARSSESDVLSASAVLLLVLSHYEYLHRNR